MWNGQASPERRAFIIVPQERPCHPGKQRSEEIPQIENAENADTNARKMRKMQLTLQEF